MLTPQKKAQLTWHCRRGMLELDLILQRFMAGDVDTLDSQDIARFERLLAAQDPDLYAWLMGYETPVDVELQKIVKRIQLHDSSRKID